MSTQHAQYVFPFLSAGGKFQPVLNLRSYTLLLKPLCTLVQKEEHKQSMVKNRFKEKEKKTGLVRESNPGPLAP